ncbi:uncharacterized protein LOC129600883 [Paramacrobiotus metropolitanus]|uniref:uncharacterized protein LOC129600883 n=1 Tax=Paramacrobiotus metropolitanus TaxID=2943436 RepID=UPI002445A546|nr:uncharacterized protein LOC129600883 [Paramacrobiotus metropolitanus]XP_055355493.1 uncharacterized protein LOC129600883 [Paramacrobiotus metropolitanus]XP_055355494.1 uncharacterized protein LOC129600883 [Paramacrobiotus metropolitanus]
MRMADDTIIEAVLDGDHPDGSRAAKDARQNATHVLTEEIWRIIHIINPVVWGLLCMALFRGVLMTLVVVLSEEFKFRDLPYAPRLTSQVVAVVGFGGLCFIFADSHLLAVIRTRRLHIQVRTFRRRPDAPVEDEQMIKSATEWLWTSHQLNTVINIGRPTTGAHALQITIFTIMHHTSTRYYLPQSRILFPVLIFESFVYLVGSYCQSHLIDLQSAILHAWYRHDVGNYEADDLPKPKRLLDLLIASARQYGEVTLY